MSTSSKTHVVTLRQPLRNARLSNAEQTTEDNSAHPSVAGMNQPTLNETTDNIDENKLVVRMLGQLNDQLRQRESQHSQSLAMLNQIAIELAITIAGKVLFQQIQADQFPVAEMVSEMLDEVDQSEQVTVFLHPLDLKLLQRKCQADDAKLVGIEQVNWIASPDLPRGSARLGNEKTGLFYDAATQLGEIRQSLMEMLYDARNERRKTGQDSSDLRRFPDRRTSG